MIRFRTKGPYEKQLDSKWYPVDCDPTLKHEIYLYSNKSNVSFEECIHIFEKSWNKTTILGSMSLIYLKYYKEFYEYLLNKRCSVYLFEKKGRIKSFKRKYLNRWVQFIKCSDDTQYPQNEYFRKMNDLFSKKKAKCPCCGYYTCNPYNLGHYDICPVCF